MLIAIRHGSYHRTNGSLDDLGQSQALAIGEYLKTFPKPSYIFHSPTQRTTEMAKIISAMLGVETRIDITLSEESTPTYYFPQTVENTTTVVITHLPVLRKLLHQWTEEFGLAEIEEIPISSVFVIDSSNKQITIASSLRPPDSA